jgi:hypothetical protein
LKEKEAHKRMQHCEEEVSNSNTLVWIGFGEEGGGGDSHSHQHFRTFDFVGSITHSFFY